MTDMGEQIIGGLTELRDALRDREAELYRVRSTEAASAHALDRVRQHLGLDLRPIEHPGNLALRIMQAIDEARG